METAEVQRVYTDLNPLEELICLFSLSWSQVPMPSLQKYCKASEKSIKCEECKKRFHTSCANLGENELLELESGNDSWYCTSCKADCVLCSGAVLYGHKAVQCDKCEIWIHNECSLITESEFDSVKNTNCTWICPKCDFLTFLIPFLIIYYTWKIKLGSIHQQRIVCIKLLKLGQIKRNLSAD